MDFTRSLPVFIHSRSLPPDNTKSFTVHEICSACEKMCGHNSIVGAQKIGSLWRIYPSTNDSRVKLLISGFKLRGYSITVCDKNPFVIVTANGEEEVKTTKLTVGNLPISFSNKEIEEMIIKLGAKPRSQLFMERDRDESGGLTRWLTGRRFMYIEVPTRPLPNKVDLGLFKASLFHIEQKVNQTKQCSQCLQPGHFTSNCPNEVICLACKRPGHKRGSPSCSVVVDPDALPPPPSPPPSNLTTPTSQSLPTTDSILPPPPPSSPSQRAGRPGSRSRSKTKQDKLHFRRREDSSTKRDRSPSSTISPSQLQQDKIARLSSENQAIPGLQLNRRSHGDAIDVNLDTLEAATTTTTGRTEVFPSTIAPT